VRLGVTPNPVQQLADEGRRPYETVGERAPVRVYSAADVAALAGERDARRDSKEH
jgi:hypothetical protein